jgi:hypothetical protein
MRRIAKMLTVVALMTAMSVAPALAASPTYTCTNPAVQHTSADVPAKQKHLFVKAGYTCTKDL